MRNREIITELNSILKQLPDTVDLNNLNPVASATYHTLLVDIKRICQYKNGGEDEYVQPEVYLDMLKRDLPKIS